MRTQACNTPWQPQVVNMTTPLDLFKDIVIKVNECITRPNSGLVSASIMVRVGPRRMHAEVEPDRVWISRLSDAEEDKGGEEEEEEDEYFTYIDDMLSGDGPRWLVDDELSEDAVARAEVELTWKTLPTVAEGDPRMAAPGLRKVPRVTRMAFR